MTLLLRVVVVRIVREERREVVVVDPSVLVPVGAVTYLRVRGEVLAIEMAKDVVEVVQAAVNEDTKEYLRARITGQTSKLETKIQNNNNKILGVQYFHRGLGGRHS